MNPYETQKRWRLILGQPAEEAMPFQLSGEDAQMDKALSSLYDANKGKGDLSKSSPSVVRWLGDIRTYFPTSVVQVMQKDALDRLGLQQMLLEPELLSSMEADVHLVSTLVGLGRAMPEKTRETARQVVKKVVDEIERKLASQLRTAITGSLNRSARNNRPRHNEIDWQRTIKANLKHYQSDYKTIIPERRIGFGRKNMALRDIVICVDQSGSMAPSVVYSSILAAVMASIRSVRTSLVVFDTAVVDLTEQLADPIDVLFGTQLGGGTDINRAIAYCETLITRPAETIFILVSDLCEGGNEKQLLSRAAHLARSGVNFITLLALSDEGAAYYDKRIAGMFAGFGIPSFACTPDLFPDLMAAAIKKQDIATWAAGHNLVTSGKLN